MSLSAVTTPPSGLPSPQRHPDAPPPGTRMDPHFARCFGCGPKQASGLHIEVYAGEGVSVTSDFTVTEDHQGAPGLAHGGVIATAFDDTIGYVLWLLHLPAVTGRLEVDYRLPLPVGTRLHIAARCTGLDGRKIYAEAEGRLGGPQGQVAARASALFVEVPPEHWERHGSEPAPEDRPVWSYNP